MLHFQKKRLTDCLWPAIPQIGETELAFRIRSIDPIMCAQPCLKQVGPES